MKWNKEYIDSLPVSSFAFIDEAGIKRFPYRDKSGQINKEQLEVSIQEALNDPVGTKAMPELKLAEKESKSGVYSSDYKGKSEQFTFSIQLTEALRQRTKPNEEKKEIVLPLLKEGWGNQKDNNYYSKKSVYEAASFLLSRNKMYMDHLENEDAPRSIKDWGASIRETWVENVDGMGAVAFGRVKVHDPWLWERYKDASDEIGTSVVGKGKAKRDTIDGRAGNLIESIEYIKSCDFVDYPGNTPLGMAKFVENEHGKSREEENPMNFGELTIAVLKENRADIVSSIEASVKGDVEKKISESNAKVAALETENKELKSKVESHELKERMAVEAKAKEELIAKCLKECDLPESGKTEVFMETLRSCKDEAKIKEQIEDRKKILGVTGVKGMGKSKEEDAKLKEQEDFNKHFLGIEPEKKEEQK